MFRSYNNRRSDACSAGAGHISWQLDDFTATAFDTIDLPLTPPELAHFTQPFGMTLDGFNDLAAPSPWLIRGEVTEATLE